MIADGEHLLVLQHVERSHSGIYRCQVSTPKAKWSLTVFKALIALFELSMSWLASFPDFFIHLRHYSVSVIGKQLLFANNRNWVRWIVLGLSQDEDWTNFVETLVVSSFKRKLTSDAPLLTHLFCHWPTPLNIVNG